jgi:hypothetical protein
LTDLSGDVAHIFLFRDMHIDRSLFIVELAEITAHALDVKFRSLKNDVGIYTLG